MKHFSKFLRRINQIILFYLQTDMRFCCRYNCHIMKIPIIHIAGGEVTEGSYDEGFVIQLLSYQIFILLLLINIEKSYTVRENPKTVFNVVVWV